MRIDDISVVPEGKSDVYLLKSMLDWLYGYDSGELTFKLIDRFGSFGGVFKATAEELLSVDGITDRVAAFFMFIRPAYRQALLRSGASVIDSEGSAARFATAFFMNKRQASDHCVFLDKKSRIIRIEKSSIEVKETVGNACRACADKLLLISGKPFAVKLGPSIDRLNAVLKIAEPLSALGIELVDHIEYGSFMFYSLRRALDGKPTPVAVDVTDESSKYTAFDFVAKLPSYIDRLEKYRSTEYLDG